MFFSATRQHIDRQCLTFFTMRYIDPKEIEVVLPSLVGGNNLPQLFLAHLIACKLGFCANLF